MPFVATWYVWDLGSRLVHEAGKLFGHRFCCSNCDFGWWTSDLDDLELKLV